MRIKISKMKCCAIVRLYEIISTENKKFDYSYSS